MSVPTTRTKKQDHPSTGVCGNCVHDDHCVFQQYSPTPITWCEEHETETVLEPTRITVPQVMKTLAVPGLCGTCDHVKTCVLRSKEHIIYHCEHYS